MVFPQMKTVGFICCLMMRKMVSSTFLYVLGAILVAVGLGGLGGSAYWLAQTIIQGNQFGTVANQVGRARLIALLLLFLAGIVTTAGVILIYRGRELSKR